MLLSFILDGMFQPPNSIEKCLKTLTGTTASMICSAENYSVSFKLCWAFLLLLINEQYTDMAVVNRKIHRNDEVRESLKTAMDIAMPDVLYMLFVENDDFIEPLICELISQRTYREQAQKIQELYEIYATAKEKSWIDQ